MLRDDWMNSFAVFIVVLTLVSLLVIFLVNVNGHIFHGIADSI